MITRCINPNNERYKDYGGRGITVCDRWLKFENFLEDMGECPPGLTLDRIKNNLGYYHGNCHWTTPKQNNRNKRNNHLITFNGKTQCLSAWAEQLNISRTTLWCRINRYNWSIEKALTIPTRLKRKKEREVHHPYL
jgi:hypothetical protein